MGRRKDYPTINQAETLAKLYKRPFALLFLPEVPLDFLPLQDFRRKDARALGTASTFMIREIQQKQAWMKDILETEDADPLPFVGRFTLQDDPSVVAKDMLKTLGIDPSHYTATNPFREWLEKAEAKGLYISRTSFIHSKMKIDSEELQGFALADPYAPFVFVNSDDWDVPQLFTLVHEIAHIWIAASGVSNEIELADKTRDKLHPVELFCNQVAAIALMPERMIKSLNADTFSSNETVFKAAKGLGVSSFALLVRAFQLEIISPSRYRALKKDAESAFKLFQEREAANAAKRKDKKGGPDYYLLLTNKNGLHFTRVVMDAFRGGFIQPSEASSLLNTQVNNFKKLESFVYK